ncbi:hypothetical protein J437_LFUL009405 [Ladona fulva]|uniref:Chorein N-terminal domain-containing protein n=1 Tax=Ladona fulva TaxID=123851 RepID=A0A8K0P129_LADFU|nr:hypothetical protein J437_LFUL009405 [Ladona fulva]
MNQFITPILLGYVNRYIKNFQPNDWQVRILKFLLSIKVSLWEGDATFNNLELRPEVLEEDFKVPFSLVSGQIYELLIHVPWTRLTWEPVVVTLNTVGKCIYVECDYQLYMIRNEVAPVHNKVKRQESENQSSYIQGLVNKILNNITVVCNNLSIKYIEEDIVLSMHVRTLMFQTADQNWNSAFLEVTEPVRRRKISVSDLTVCLDKRNASGKIEAYHEPVLYRSSLEFRLMMYYRNQPDGRTCGISDLKAIRATDGGWGMEDEEKEFLVMRLDVRAAQILDFQLNEEQLPMFFRLCELCRALAKGDLPRINTSSSEDSHHFGPVPEKGSSVTSTQGPAIFGSELENETDASKTGWTEYFSTFFPSVEEELDMNEPKFEPQIWDFGFYIQKLSLELKVMDRGQEHAFYGPTKVGACTSPFTSIVLHGVSAQLLKLACDKNDDEGAKTMFNLRLGASQVLVEPLGGICPCGMRDAFAEYSEDALGKSGKEMNQPFFMYAGGDLENFDRDSLFDENSSENAGTLRPYNCSRVHHVETVTETAMLDRTPALALDFLYTLVTPTDWDLESLSKLRDLEYSNFEEESLIRILLGPAHLKVCASFIHRVQLLLHLASNCDYPPYSVIPDSKFCAKDSQSQTASDILENSNPADIYRITLFRPFIQFYLNDHPEYKPGEPKVKKKVKKTSSTKKILQLEEMPSVSFQSKYIDAKIVKPMYPRRLAESIKGLRRIPGNIMDIMYHSYSVEVDRLNVAPQVENPIGRVHIRPDIYTMAEEAKILDVPGSVVEDRQYQIQVHNIGVSTGMWYELEHCFEKDPMVSSNSVRGENPALEWSKLAKGRNCLAPDVSVLPLVNRFNLCITAAPAVVYKPPSDGRTRCAEVLVCGYAMEVHAASDIDACASTYQVELLSEIVSEFLSLTEERDLPMADASLDGITIKYLKTQNVEAYHLTVSSVKVLLLKADSKKGNLRQTLILSGPEEETKESDEHSPPFIIKVTLQQKIDGITGKPVTKLINPLLAFQVNHAHMCMDQLLVDWLSPIPSKLKSDLNGKNGFGSMKKTSSVPPRIWKRAASEEAPTVTASSTEVANRRRRASTSSSSRTVPPAPPESVHSSSERGLGYNRRYSGGNPTVYDSSSALAEVEENEDLLEEGLEDLEPKSSSHNVFEYFLEIFKAWCGATVVGKVKKLTAYIPATIGDGCVSSEGSESIPQTILNTVSNGKVIGALVIDFPCLSLHSAGVQGDIFLQNCFSQFPVKTTAHNMEKNIKMYQ